MTPKQKFFATASKHCIHVEHEPRSITHPATVDLYSPDGKVFVGSGCHTDCSIQDLTDADSIDWPAALTSLERIIAIGFEDCPDGDACDYCHPEIEGA